MGATRICVVGAGTMGNGIAQVSAQAGYDTVMVDIEQALVDRGMTSIQDSLARLVKKGGITQQNANDVLSRVHPSTDLEDAAREADYVIEAVYERTDVKLPVLEQLDEVCKPETVFASNTSGIPISLIASAARRPEKVIGMHFMNPVPVMPGVEVIRSLLTSEETLNRCIDLVSSFGKQAVVVKDAPGFIANRLYAVVWNEAARLLEENIACIEDIDKMMKLSFTNEVISSWTHIPFSDASVHDFRQFTSSLTYVLISKISTTRSLACSSGCSRSSSCSSSSAIMSPPYQKVCM